MENSTNVNAEVLHAIFKCRNLHIWER